MSEQTRPSTEDLRSNGSLAMAEDATRTAVFPLTFHLQGGQVHTHGITKRELFASMIAGDLAASYAQGGDFMETHVAKGAVKIADALLKELAK